MSGKSPPESGAPRPATSPLSDLIVRLLVQRVEGEAGDATQGFVNVPPQLIVRASTAPPRIARSA